MKSDASAEDTRVRAHVQWQIVLSDWLPWLAKFLGKSTIALTIPDRMSQIGRGPIGRA
jgi:hypothetical protein